MGLSLPPPDPHGVAAASSALADYAPSGKIATAGAAALFGGSFLPWAQVTTVFGTLSLNGTTGDGVLTALAGAVAAIGMFVGFSKPSRKAFTIGVVFAALGGVVALYTFGNVSEFASEESQYAFGQVGYGLYLCLAGAAVAFAAGLTARGKVPKDLNTSAPGQLTEL